MPARLLEPPRAYWLPGRLPRASRKHALGSSGRAREQNVHRPGRGQALADPVLHLVVADDVGEKIIGARGFRGLPLALFPHGRESLLHHLGSKSLSQIQNFLGH